MNIVDRRLNPGGKSHSNRQRFLRRAKAVVQRAVRDGASERSIKDLERGGEVTISTNDVHEPRLRRSRDRRDAEPYPSRQQALRRGRYASSRRRPGRRRLVRAGRGRRRLGRFQRGAEPRGVPGPLPRRPRAPGPHQAAPRDPGGRRVQARRLYDDRLAGQSRPAADHAPRDVPPHRHAAAETRRTLQPPGGDPTGRGTVGAGPAASRPCRRNSRDWSSAAVGSPTSIPSTCGSAASNPSRGRSRRPSCSA